MEELIMESEEQILLLMSEWIPRLIAYVITSGVFISLQTLFSKWIHKLRSSKFTVANLFSAFYLTTLSFDGSFISGSAFKIMTIGLVLFWSLFIIGDLLKELKEMNLKIGSFEINMIPNRRKEDNKNESK